LFADDLQTRDYLPVPQQSTTNGAIYGQNSDLIDFPVGDPAGIYQGEKAFSEKTLENSPLDRLLEQKQVGTAWNGKPVKFEYATNTSTDVRKYVTTTTSIGDITTSVLNVSNDSNSLNGFYKANQLYKNSVKDEDVNETIEFKNGRGQTVLVRKVINATDNADTYYIYNEYGQLAFVIPPKASFAIKGLGVGLQIADTTLNDLCYQYRYDGKNRLVEKKLPGKGWEYMVYDKADRLIMTQDAELRKINKWLVTKYDLLGRVVYTGIFSSLEGRPSLQSLLNNYVITEYRNAQGFTKNGMQIYYSKDFVDLETVLSVNYYDNYLTGDPFPTLVFDQTVLPSDVQQYGRSTKGLPVSSFVKNIEDDSWTKNYFYYDIKGRSIREFTLNHLGGYTNVEKQLDFSGVVKEILTQHKRLATDTEKTIREKFTYDDQNRLISHSHQVGAGAIEFLARNKYNELSQLEYKKVGGTVTAPFQQVDYKYNIRGWVTQINDPNALGGDLFGYKIKYNQVEGQESPNMDYSTLKVLPKYNGNIAEVDWKTSTIPNDNLRRYGYVYDNLNRLVAGFYQKDTNPSAKEYFEMMEYDLNGNITNLKRSADVLSGDPNTKLIDNLKYDYTGNKLTKVTEQQQNSTGYPYFVAPNEIGYDLNGSMISYKDKDLELIEYNFLNLPSKITGKPGQTQKNSTNLYRADGVKIRKIFSASSAMITQTDYLDGFQYKDAVLQFVPSAEGYYDFVKNKYIYNYTDHLGNVRLSYQKGTSGLEVIEENNYYPFGLKHDGYNGLAGNSAYQYKYNGKELQETGMYDYGARMYMPDIGRWGVVDPLSELQFAHSPYSYVFNNPVYFNDPTGMIGEACDTCPDKSKNPEKNPNARGGANNPAEIEGVVITGIKKFTSKAADIISRIDIQETLSLLAPIRPGTPEENAWLRDRYGYGKGVLSDIQGVGKLIMDVPSLLSDSFSSIGEGESGEETVIATAVLLMNVRKGKFGNVARMGNLGGKFMKLARTLKLNIHSPTTMSILENADNTVQEFISAHRQGSIKSVFPAEHLNSTVKEALQSGNTTVRKLLTDSRFLK
ncbi:RHS repeat-associated core domain-containing protein, partial [Chryseobacterium sp. ISL-6]|uniref:RHS repeat-associated core domain-containing protein n=2 Tax=Chryseobacterium TaxID=59732 RepID=UPI001BED1BB7